jgi:cellobiose transport system substrate-binding protein
LTGIARQGEPLHQPFRAEEHFMHTTNETGRRPARSVLRRLARPAAGLAHLAASVARPAAGVARTTARPARPARAGVLVTGMVALAAAVAACSGGDLASPQQTQPAYHGPVVTVHVAVYGNPGYQQGGVYSSFERLHPGIHVVQDIVPGEGVYWQGTKKRLASGKNLADLITIPMDEMASTVAKFRNQLVPLNSLGGTSNGVNQFEDQWLPWIWQPASHGGQDYAVGAETGPLAICYRPMLLRSAGLASTPAQLAKSWSTWSGYLAYGHTFKQRIPRGPAFMDSVTGMYKAMISQATEQYYSASGKLVAAHNPAVKNAWNTAVQASKDGLSAKAPALSPSWDAGVTRVQFATGVCAPWMLGSIEQLSGNGGSGTWAVARIPGGTGNWDGFYLAIPRSSPHQQAAYELAMYLTSQEAGVPVTGAGGFPASSPAINAAATVTSPYFSGSPIGKIFGVSADRVPAAPTGPASDKVTADFATAIAKVEAGTSTPTAAWAHAQHQATTATH